MKTTFLFVCGLLGFVCANAQSLEAQIQTVTKQLATLEASKAQFVQQVEELKLNWIQQEIDRVGVPKINAEQEVISHAAMRLSYNEQHEQPNWVMHLILPDIKDGNVTRTNDFRVDTLIKTGSAEELDYFLKTLKEDGENYAYDGFGYDRGHLAPSADFRWSQTALSESYFYSNMSPQVADFNREAWAELESWLRGYVIRNNVELYVVTIPVLDDGLPKVERSKNGLSVPKQFVKAALDIKNNEAIAFVMPNTKILVPIESFAKSIDEVEELLEFDLFPNLKAQVANAESTFNVSKWMPDNEQFDVVAIDFKELPKGAINTYQVPTFVNDGKKHTVCGTVVSTKKSGKGNVFLNLDKRFPNQIFSVSIFKKSIVNFSYEPEEFLMDKKVCITGKIGEYQGTPSMSITGEKAIRLFEEIH